MLLARVQDGPHTTHHSIDASDEIPEFLTSPRTSSIYTIEKVGKGSLATIVSFPEMSECDLCRPTPIGHSARHRVTAENAEVHRVGRERQENFAGGTDGGSGYGAEKYGPAGRFISLVPSLADDRCCVVR
jgi:hypothetical protein